MLMRRAGNREWGFKVRSYRVETGTKEDRNDTTCALKLWTTSGMAVLEDQVEGESNDILSESFAEVKKRRREYIRGKGDFGSLELR